MQNNITHHLGFHTKGAFTINAIQSIPNAQHHAEQRNTVHFGAKHQSFSLHINGELIESVWLIIYVSLLSHGGAYMRQWIGSCLSNGLFGTKLNQRCIIANGNIRKIS